MAIAYVLLNSELGQDSTVETSLKDVPEVKEVYAVYGVYDFIVKLEAVGMSELKDIITNKIRRIQNVRSSLTLITVE
ncbi:MAG: Lrp/AsnC ligand binding domain-containing protein [Candidatus Bathyarchaeota archaeon]